MAMAMMAKEVRPLDRADVINRFTYHPATRDQAEKHDMIRSIGRGFALHLLENAPGCREQSLAITKIEEAVMWANAAIARNES
jgi:hypothetical protein